MVLILFCLSEAVIPTPAITQVLIYAYGIKKVLAFFQRNINLVYIFFLIYSHFGF